ncbi:MAG: hypothetical protein C4554_10595 [Dethiobacter sp.]|jgi:hypothetical protein|nr:MAG: hypothetical protein C4554_10595 [Dethiobacter sp.]
MNGQVPEARWTVTQPWRGLFGLAVTVIVAFIITASFNMEKFGGFVTLLIMSFVPILTITGAVWRGQYPPTENLQLPWRGMLLVAFVMLFGVLICFGLLNFMSAGVPQPYANIYCIITVVVTFFAILAFDTWPFRKMSLPARGFLTLITTYLLAWFIMRLFNFSMLSYPTGVNPSPIGAVPFYAEGGPLASFANIAPSGSFPWEMAISYSLWAVTFLFVFAMLGMWPFSRFKMQQPVFGIVILVACLVLGYIAFTIGVSVMKIEPLTFQGYAISYLFGILMIMNMFQMWPGRVLGPVVGGFINLALAVVFAIIGHYGVGVFCQWHFGEAMTYPNNIFAVANVMLGLCFPLWAAYSDFFDFWPLPPTPNPSA